MIVTGVDPAGPGEDFTVMRIGPIRLTDADAEYLAAREHIDRCMFGNAYWVRPAAAPVVQVVDSDPVDEPRWEIWT